MLLEGKVAIVTGGDSGIGHAICLALASEGAAVTINYHKNQAAADATLKEVTDAGGKGLVVQGDVSQVADLQKSGRRDGRGVWQAGCDGQQRRHGDAHLDPRLPPKSSSV